MLTDLSTVDDAVLTALARTRTPHDGLAICGWVTVELRGGDGRLKHVEVVPNIVTQIGDQMYAERSTGIAGAPNAVTGMKLGAGSTTPAKTGAGAALVTYLSNSHQAIDAGYPQSSLVSGKRRITWQSTWAAGKATTASPITEVVIVNETLSDATSAAAATISRALVTGVSSKDAADVLTIGWTHDLGT